MRPLFSKDGFSYQICPGCGLVRLFPQPTDAQLDAIYNGGYFKHWGESESVFYKMKRHTFGRLLDMLPKAAKPQPRFLDVGAATGIMMETAKDRGYEVYGVEASRDGAEAIAKKFGGERIANCYFDASFDRWSDGFFDVLCMSDLFEHVRSPKNVLEKVHSLLARSGLFLLYLPNTASFACRLMGREWPYFCPEHLYSFSVKNLKVLLERQGFDVIAAKSEAKYLTAEYLAGCLLSRKRRLTTFLARILQFIPQKLASISLPVPVGQSMLVARKVERK
jgi:2-polyprenyl-3-methyl-5-hydroxy-6-metoxy-1,4-benzoquinol methylase